MPKRSSGTLVENIKTIVYAGLIAIGIRTIAFEPFNIPSGSMIPTLLVGDYLFVSKYSYGYSKYSLPFSPNLFSGRIFASLPRRGDVAVFKLPRDNATDYIKRIVGLPGDRVQMKAGQLYINGEAAPRRLLGDYQARDGRVLVQFRHFAETLPGNTPAAGHVHEIVKMYDAGGLNDTVEFRVPADHVFAMGDNRDNSSDSRDPSGGVGFIPLENLVGRAEFIFLSVDSGGPDGPPFWHIWNWPSQIRWSRLFSGIT